MSMHRAACRFFLVALTVTMAGGARGEAPGRLHWENTPGQSIALVDGEDVVWKFQFGPGVTKPCFHPLAPRGGPSVTAMRPADHPWHLGAWFSWKYVNGLNYWEEDPATKKSQGITEWADVVVTPADDHTARVTMTLGYHPPGKPDVLTERREIAIGAPGADGAYEIDWHSTFTAMTDVTLDRTPLPTEPKGQPWGGYAGLSVRFAEGMADRHVTSPDGPIDTKPGRYRGRHRAVDYSGTFAGRTAGVAIADHPDNLGSPSPWYCIAGDPMSFFSPAVLCFKPHEIKEGESLTLRYRILVHSGRLEPQTLSQWSEHGVHPRQK
jgi:hypothetical protein